MPFFTPESGTDRTVSENEILRTTRTLTGSSYTTTTADINAHLVVNASDEFQVTLPANLPVGAEIHFTQFGTGFVHFYPGDGATIPQIAIGGKSYAWPIPNQYCRATAMVVANADGDSAVWIVTSGI